VKFSVLMKGHEGQVCRAVVILAARGNDMGPWRQVAVQVSHVQRRQQLAHGEVAHPAKDDHVEWQAGVELGSSGHVKAQKRLRKRVRMTIIPKLSQDGRTTIKEQVWLDS
jgi:hypothetical protein